MKPFRYRLTFARQQKISVPIGSRLLHAGIDRNGNCAIWLLVNPESPTTEIEIFRFGTGDDVGHVGTFLGTIIADGYVWHFFTGPGCAVERTNDFHYLSREA